jgi:hypothetical protein
MNDKIKYLVIVLVVFVAGALFAFSIKPGQVVAENTKVKTLRDGNEFLCFILSSCSPEVNILEIPAGVVLTDLVLDPQTASVEDPCKTLLLGVLPDGSEHVLLDLDPIRPTYENDFSPTNAELHLESGLQSTVERKIVVRLVGGCRVRAFWTGYEQ